MSRSNLLPGFQSILHLAVLPATPALDTFPRAPRGRAGTAFAGRELPGIAAALKAAGWQEGREPASW